MSVPLVIGCPHCNFEMAVDMEQYNDEDPVENFLNKMISTLTSKTYERYHFINKNKICPKCGYSINTGLTVIASEVENENSENKD